MLQRFDMFLDIGLDEEQDFRLVDRNIAQGRFDFITVQTKLLGFIGIVERQVKRGRGLQDHRHALSHIPQRRTVDAVVGDDRTDG